MNSPQAPYAPFQAIKALIARTNIPERTRMTRVLMRAAHWRQQMLVNTFRAKQGNAVHSGPFAGMTYLDAAEGALLPRLMGCYEAELHDTILQMRHAGYQNVIDIGCAEGYYAVGLARLFNDCQIYAHDISENAQRACTELAKVNHVSDRVHVGGVFDGDTLAQHTHNKTLVFCDIEGAEEQLLDPEKYPAFRNVDLIVEVHECYKPGLIKTLTERFSATHDIEWLWQSPSAPRDLPEWTRDMPHFEQILCTWEWREGPTPWAIMRNRVRTEQPISDALPVVFALHDSDGQYWLNTATAMTSVLQHTTQKLQIHLLHNDTLKTIARDRLTQIAQQFNTPIRFTHVDLPEEIDTTQLHRFSPASLYRLMIPKLFANEPVVIYLDSDLVSHGVDLKDLANALPTQAPIGGVIDPYIGTEIKTRMLLEKIGIPAERYFNSGVLVLRPPKIQADLLSAFVKFNEDHPDALHPDQDFLNLYFRDRVVVLDAKFNHQVCLFQRSLFHPLNDYAGKILHYAGKLKPLDGNLAPGMLPFWMYTHATPEISRLNPTMRYLELIKDKPNAVYRALTDRERAST